MEGRRGDGGRRDEDGNLRGCERYPAGPTTTSLSPRTTATTHVLPACGPSHGRRSSPSSPSSSSSTSPLARARATLQGLAQILLATSQGAVLLVRGGFNVRWIQSAGHGTDYSPRHREEGFE